MALAVCAAVRAYTTGGHATALTDTQPRSVAWLTEQAASGRGTISYIYPEAPRKAQPVVLASTDPAHEEVKKAAQTELKNAGKNCWQACGKAGGFCSYCR